MLIEFERCKTCRGMFLQVNEIVAPFNCTCIVYMHIVVVICCNCSNASWKTACAEVLLTGVFCWTFLVLVVCAYTIR